MAKTMRDVLNDQNVQELTNVNGTPLISYEEQVKTSQEMIREKVDTRWDTDPLKGIRKTNPDGTIARSNYKTAAINKDRFYDNRCRVVDGELQIVTAQTTDGYRAIMDQSRGRVFSKLIPCSVIKRDNGKLVLDRNIQVSDTDFVTYFTTILDEDAMKQVLVAIQHGAQSTPKEKLPI